jgi:hypothetical protein
MFKLILSLDIADGRPGMLVPLFSSPTTNMPYVQQMDEFLLVKEMVPFLDYENYPIILHDTAHTVSIGNKGIIAFRSSDNSIIAGDFEVILSYISQNSELIANNPLLRMQLHRIETAEVEKSCPMA